MLLVKAWPEVITLSGVHCITISSVLVKIYMKKIKQKINLYSVFFKKDKIQQQIDHSYSFLEGEVTFCSVEHYFQKLAYVHNRETERQRDRETERQRDRETERQRDRETERQRERLRQRDGEKD
jgi:hypothetical protein